MFSMVISVISEVISVISVDFGDFGKSCQLNPDIMKKMDNCSSFSGRVENDTGREEDDRETITRIRRAAFQPARAVET